MKYFPVSLLMLKVPTSVVVDEDAIKEFTKKFEAKHEECVRVLPYKDKDGYLEVHLYVYTDKSGLLEDLEVAARECFGEMDVGLEWLDLYNKGSTVLNVSPVEYPSGRPNRLEAGKVDEISEIISKNLDIFSKHRNITAMQPSFKVIKSTQTSDPCIAVYVLGKGRIPLGESEIPRSVDGCAVDIVDGFWFEIGKPWKPTEAQQQFEILPLGASIGVKGVKASGTLGAIVEDENNRGTLYALSCDHVIKMNGVEQMEIVHPGGNDYLNYFKWTLKTYLELLRNIPGPCCIDNVSVDDLRETEELSILFNDLRMIKKAHLELLCNDQTNPQAITFSNQGEHARFKYYFPDDDQARKNRLSSLQQKTVSKLLEHEKVFEQSLLKQPRNIAKYTTGIRDNVLSGDKCYFIDAAIAELSQDEVEKLRDSGTTEVIGIHYYPSGHCTPATTEAIMSAGEMCKSGRTTAHTTSRGLVGHSTDAPMFLQTKTIKVNGALPDAEMVYHFCQNCAQERKSPMGEYKQQVFCSCKTCNKGEVSHYGSKWLSNCLCIVSESQPFANKGDSGAVVFEKCDGNPPDLSCLSGFGVLFGVFNSAHKSCALASPIEVTLAELSRKFSDSCNLRLVSNYYE